MLSINEICKVYQGEGLSLGQPRLMIRLNSCNLRCNFCDTPYALGKGDKDLDILEYEELLSSNKEWMITGGEPLLNQYNLIELIHRYNPSFVEIETNGTFEPNKELDYIVDQWNVSPKNKKDQTIDCNVEPILLSKFHVLNKVIVKFVVETEEDWSFVEGIATKYSLAKTDIWIMPKTLFNLEKDNILRREVYEKALSLDYNFTPRLHVMMFGNKRGV